VKRKNPHGKRKRSQKIEGNKVSSLLLFLSMVFLFFVTGCGGGSPLPPPPQKGKSPAAESKKVEPVKAPEKKELEKKEEAEYTYNPAGKPDPFKSFIQITSAKGYSRRVPLTPLQKYEIRELKLVAIIATSEGNIALIEDATGKGYLLRKGTPIGKNDGKVKRILQDKVIIEEVYEDISEPKKMNEISLFLHQVEEGGES